MSGGDISPDTYGSIPRSFVECDLSVFYGISNTFL